VPLLTLGYVPVLGVGVRDEVQSDAGESVQLLKSLSIDLLVDFFKAVSVRRNCLLTLPERFARPQ
jgi:hypothetical protein